MLSVVNPGSYDLRDRVTDEWSSMLVRGRSGPRRFAEALPSEDDEEHSRDANKDTIVLHVGKSRGHL